MLSIVLNTKQDLCPMNGLDEDIFTVLINQLSSQSYKDFELVMVDRFYNERRYDMDKRKRSFPMKYIPTKPSPWFELDKNAITISNDRNAGIIMASGDVIMCIDDCCVPMHTDFLKMYMEHLQRGILLRPILFGYDYSKKPVKIDSDPLVAWRATQPKKEFHEVSGNCPRCYFFPTKTYEDLGGFDQNFDGSWGCEDSDWYKRVDKSGIKRFITGNGQHHIAVIHHKNLRYSHSGYVCNEAYAQWKYEQIDKLNHVVANQRNLDDTDISAIRLRCQTCPTKCERNEPPGLELYMKMQRTFSLADQRKDMTKAFGSKTGAFDPWR